MWDLNQILEPWAGGRGHPLPWPSPAWILEEIVPSFFGGGGIANNSLGILCYRDVLLLKSRGKPKPRTRISRDVSAQRGLSHVYHHPLLIFLKSSPGGAAASHLAPVHLMVRPDLFQR